MSTFEQAWDSGLRAMSSSPSEMVQFSMSQLVPAGSMPSVLAVLAGVLMVTPLTVMLLSPLPHWMCSWGELLTWIVWKSPTEELVMRIMLSEPMPPLA